MSTAIERPGTGRPDARPDAQRVESAEKRRQRLSTGVLIAVVGVLLLIAPGLDHRQAQFALSDAFDEVQLPTVSLPGFGHGRGLRRALPAGGRRLSCPVGCRGRWPALAGTVAGLAVVLGLPDLGRGRAATCRSRSATSSPARCRWPRRWSSGRCAGCCASGPAWSTCRIEGQFLAAAFAAAVVGSLTQSVPAAMVAAMRRRRGHGRAAGAVLDQLPGQPGRARRGAQPAGGRGHRLPVRPAGAAGVERRTTRPRCWSRSPSPGLSKIPFFGRVLFEQSILAYLAGLVGRGRLGAALPDHLGPAGPGDRRAPGGGRHGRHQRARPSAGRPCWPAACSPGSAARSSPWPRPARSPRSSPSATGSSPWPR